jgi:hypothetical protein
MLLQLKLIWPCHGSGCWPFVTACVASRSGSCGIYGEHIETVIGFLMNTLVLPVVVIPPMAVTHILFL